MRLLCLLIATSFFYAQETLDIALEKYAAGVRAEDATEKSALLNEALQMFLTVEREKPSGELEYNIANTYFYLGDLGLAIAYYRHAQNYLPRDPRLQRNLQIALERAQVKDKQIEWPVRDLIGFRWCSPFERFLICLGVIIFTFVLFSLHIYFSGFRVLWIISGTLTGIILFCITVFPLFFAERAVVLRVVPICTQPDSKPETSLSAGEMVDVLGIEDQYARIRTSDQRVGYVPKKKIMFVDV